MIRYVNLDDSIPQVKQFLVTINMIQILKVDHKVYIVEPHIISLFGVQLRLF